MVEHQTNGCGATCSNSHSCSSFIFFQNCTDPGFTGREKQRKKKIKEINTCESRSCLKLKFVSNIL